MKGFVNQGKIEGIVCEKPELQTRGGSSFVYLLLKNLSKEDGYSGAELKENFISFRVYKNKDKKMILGTADEGDRISVTFRSKSKGMVNSSTGEIFYNVYLQFKKFVILEKKIKEKCAINNSVQLEHAEARTKKPLQQDYDNILINGDIPF